MGMADDEFAVLAEQDAVKRLSNAKFTNLLERILDGRIPDASPDLILWCRIRCLAERRAYTLLREIGVRTVEQEVSDHDLYEKFLEATNGEK